MIIIASSLRPVKLHFNRLQHSIKTKHFNTQLSLYNPCSIYSSLIQEVLVKMLNVLPEVFTCVIGVIRAQVIQTN